MRQHEAADRLHAVTDYLVPQEFKYGTTGPLLVSRLVSVIAEAAVATRFALSFWAATTATSAVHAGACGAQHSFKLLADAAYMACAARDIGKRTGVRNRC
jgi:hypothetical protein